MTDRPDQPLRVVLQQPALPKYRVAAFRELSRRPGIDLELIYSQTPNLPNVEPDGFRGRMVPTRHLAGGRVMWHGPQWSSATRRACDVLILTWNTRYLSLAPALLRARANGVRTVLFGHGTSHNESPRRRKLRERVGRLADALLFYGERGAETYRAAGWDAQRVFVAPNALDQTAIRAARAHWAARPNELAAHRRALGLGDGPTMLFVSRLLPENRLDLALDAMVRLRDSFPTLTLVIVGKGPADAELRAQADRLGLASGVRFIGPVYDELALAPHFLSADVLVYPANAGLSIMHSFGYGLPMVVAATVETQGPEREAVREDVNGLTFRDGDADDLARALRRVLGDASLRQRLSAGALATVEGEYSIARMVDGFEAAIRGVPRDAVTRTRERREAAGR